MKLIKTQLDKIYYIRTMKSSYVYENIVMCKLFQEKKIQLINLCNGKEEREYQKAVSLLIKENIIIETSSNEENYYEFHSPKCQLALEHLMKKYPNQK